MDSMLRVMLAAGGGGGGGGCDGSGPVLATAWDDTFSCGTTMDTTGARFAGANPWTGLHLDASSWTVSGGLVTGTGGTYEGQNGPRIYYQSFGAGDFRFRTKLTVLSFGSGFPHFGMYLGESATGKFYVGGTSGAGGIMRYTSEVVFAGDYAVPGDKGPGLTYYCEFERVGATLTFKINDNATDGDDLTTALGSSAFSISQTTDFTTAPDRIGIAVNGGSGASAAYDWFRRLV